MRLHFIRFDVEESKNDCELYDKVEIYDRVYDMDDYFDDDLITTLCGDSLPDDIISSGNIVLVEFTSDDTRNYAGFRIQYTAINGKITGFMF